MTTKTAKPSEKPAKAAPASAAQPAVQPARAAKPKAAKPVPKEADPKPAPEKAPKSKKASKVIRDSFTFPESDYQKISELKKSCLAIGVNAKKSEILRAGLHALVALEKEKLRELISKIEKIKTGRPLGSEKS